MVVEIRHVTRYEYSRDVLLGEHRMMLRPKEGANLQLMDFDLRMKPEGKVRWGMDIFGNWVAWVTYSERASELEVESFSRVKICVGDGRDFVLDRSAVMFPFAYDAEEQRDLQPYLEAAYMEDRGVVRQWLTKFWKPGMKLGTLDLLLSISRRIHEEFRYQRRDEMGVQSPSETLRKGSGSCRDFAVLCMEGCRVLGMAARFVSGYVMPLNSPVVEHASTHAWVEVYLPGAGWRGIDPTVGVWGEHCHIPVATTRHSSQAAPIRGVFAGDANAFKNLHVDVKLFLVSVIN
jgi:transglutaminase-like putative cysteine protease